MAELQAEVIGAAEMVVVEYIRKALEDEKPFRSVGVAYILFASKRAPTLSIAFPKSSKDPIRRFKDFLPMKDHSYQLVLDSIVADYPLTVEEAVACTSIYLSTHTGWPLWLLLGFISSAWKK